MGPTVGEFHYRLRAPVSGYRPGSHPGTALGSGHEFAAHVRLLDNPDPRRIDIRASLRNVRREWLTQVYRQRAALAVYAVVDVSESMQFGEPRPKLAVATDFVESLGLSAYRAGDPVGLLGFDTAQREDLFVPARHSRAAGTAMGSRLRQAQATTAPQRARTPARALGETVQKLIGKRCLVFLVSDFHWPLDQLGPALDMLAEASVIPVVIWDRAEVTPPVDDGLLRVRDAENGGRRSLWMTPALRARWLQGVADHRAALDAAFSARHMRPFYVQDVFAPEQLSRYFLEDYA